MTSSVNGKGLGLVACTAVVVGNVIGSGFYVSPAAVAPYGQLAILMWIVMGIGAVCLGLAFARLARIAPATGGPYAYTRMAYGDFAGFLVAWVYWISVWASLPAIAFAFAGAIFKLAPGLQSRPVAIALTIGSIWAVALINLRGVKAAGAFATVATFTKLVPFIVLSLVGLFYLKPANLAGFNPSGQPVLASLAALAPLTMFAYLGMESATVPAGDVRDPTRTIPRSTVIGILIAAVFYVVGTVVVFGLVPRGQLVGSISPFSDAARVLWGDWGGDAIALAVIVSSIGALNGWALLMGQVPMAAARDRLFPAVFGRMSSRGVPALGIVISAALATGLLLMAAWGTKNAQSFYSEVVNLATMAAVVPYAFCALAVSLISAGSAATGKRHRLTAVEWIAFAFSIFTLYGCGPQAVLYGTILLMLGIPIFVWLRTGAPKE
ncbi:MAG: amino acid permease [Burkholderiales bacterium]